MEKKENKKPKKEKKIVFDKKTLTTNDGERPKEPPTNG